MTNFLDLATKRRSIYNLGDKANHSIEEIAEYLGKLALEAPSASNSQTTRLVVVSGEARDKVGEVIEEAQTAILGDQMLEWFKGVHQGALAGVGAVLFFEDRKAVDSMPAGSQERRELYKEQNAAIVQYSTWLGLAELGYGASLQHFNVGYKEGYDKKIKEVLGLPENWELNAQMPFGSIEEPAGDIEKISLDEQVRVIK